MDTDKHRYLYFFLIQVFYDLKSDFTPVSFKHFEDVYKKLSEKLHPQVYELGFLKA